MAHLEKKDSPLAAWGIRKENLKFHNQLHGECR
jgi:hypothetical protein